MARMERAEGELPFPFLVLILSGGHTALLLARGVGNYLQLGTTVDDSVGEAVDKAARILGLPYDPTAGPAAGLVEAALRGEGDPRIHLPGIKSRHMAKGLDFTFSGVKTAFERACDALRDGAGQISPADQNNLAWAFMDHCSRQIGDRVLQASLGSHLEDDFGGRTPVPLVICGGAARNRFLSQRLASTLDGRFRIFCCAPQYCVDNAVMIGWTAVEHVRADLEPMRLDSVRQDWPLVELKLDQIPSPPVNAAR